MFKVHLLPAKYGDCIWIEYGPPDYPYHILLDGGTATVRELIAKRMNSYDKKRFELVCVSHVDEDHIAGVLSLLQNDMVNFEVGDFWFNSYEHLTNKEKRFEKFGPKQGDALGEEIESYRFPWNTKFDKKAVVIPDVGPLPKKCLDGKMEITLLTPTKTALESFIDEWEEAVKTHKVGQGTKVVDEISQEEIAGPKIERFGRRPPLPDIEALSNSKFKPDGSPANATSIAFIAEYKGKRALFAADAHVDDLIKGLHRFSPEQKISLDLFKVSHHGAEGTTNKELIQAVDCKRYAISTSGSKFKKPHPHPEAIARIISESSQKAELIFNYESKVNKIWKRAQNSGRFVTRFPLDQPGITIDLFQED